MTKWEYFQSIFRYLIFFILPIIDFTVLKTATIYLYLFTFRLEIRVQENRITDDELLLSGLKTDTQ